MLAARLAGGGDERLRRRARRRPVERGARHSRTRAATLKMALHPRARRRVRARTAASRGAASVRRRGKLLRELAQRGRERARGRARRGGGARAGAGARPGGVAGRLRGRRARPGESRGQGRQGLGRAAQGALAGHRLTGPARAHRSGAAGRTVAHGRGLHRGPTLIFHQCGACSRMLGPHLCTASRCGRSAHHGSGLPRVKEALPGSPRPWL
jgi:hypothetical protein